ncbi:type I-E CRISPR-associated protein Cse2/CasB [Sulfurivermis fontis]|uniref:type I-E CRISPR-associated protein Cse2/CasB n=1 Tax=Sulfurivermis fontis TaxID=1972068 RepID=UPI000FDADD61|nr:type I-E CRISPR-associated protein Cse2/CasB [Sulfurivermis fontis]
MSISFNAGRPAGDIVAGWWEGLQQDSGGRAQLRRCKSPDEVMLEPAFHRLLNRMRGLLESDGNMPVDESYRRLAAVAGLLSHVKKPDNKALAERMAESKGGRPRFSSLRFRRLMKESFDDLYPAMIRVIRQLDKTASLSDLANSVFYWGDKVRKDWALAYFPNVVE